ncbi:enoyl-CoA hydratase/isomerase family protein [Agrococcus sediminis]|uniref:3-hydroxyisobutyryl-CoA hydrolase n=1 Tax=Agrococcus sediminis TaxID=2599924 RepID=A0A5M8QJ97_9MICO|nr:enoyl-CoA hydratase/isomerase family protein [Agrococcus sediminis]KAA6435221.1 enoyl-CoA hydratase/isomerase family protein [Agrococcus sediminis]
MTEPTLSATASASASAPPAEHVRVERRGALGVIVLDRQRALNALTHAMVRDVADALRTLAADDEVECVAITGAGERALCAGGDVVSLRDDVQSNGGRGAARFWRDEYAMNAAIARFPKPVVAIQHGIVLGGGVGISGHASHRVATGSTRIGFPEVTIGFVPDVGATWLLTRRSGELGTRAALTGDHFGAADAIALGLSDAHVPDDRLPELLALLETTHPDDAIARLATAPPAGTLQASRPLIDHAFAGDDPALIVARLRAAGDEGVAMAGTIAERSPFAVAVTLAALRRARRMGSLEEALVQEFRVSRHVSLAPDFAEGVRAQLVDKDRRPRWRPASLAGVTPAMVEACFAPVPEGDLALPTRSQQEERA